MAVVNVKSNSVIGLDASPIVAQAAGEGGPADTKCNDGVFSGSNAPPAAASIGSTFQFVRVPSNCKIKKIWIESAAQGAGTMNVGLTYATDGSVLSTTPPTVVGAGGATLFASAYALTAASQPTDISNQSGNYTADKRQLPLWKAAGLTADPGGYFDITGTLAVAITTGTGTMGLTVVYTD
jgi:hypothetical protein